ncbi:MAG: hypothetical protein HUU55_08035 [Myxococcales bacterium]|nr:hypothetical protein [Myxococcales bacterium]
MTDFPLNDAMPPRRIQTRWVICGVLTAQSALHLGDESNALVEMSVVRDERSGQPLLLGTTLAGALRSALCDRLAGYRTDETKEVAMLFGGAHGDDTGAQSPLIVFDALGRLPEGGKVEVRDGVAINSEFGVADDHKKWEFEVLPPGTSFKIRLDLLIYPSEDERRLLEYLAAAVNIIATSEQNIGARRSRGMGLLQGQFWAQRFDLADKSGWMEWLRTDPATPMVLHEQGRNIYEALNAVAPAHIGPIDKIADTRRRVIVELNLRLKHDLLVRSPSMNPETDIVHLTSGGKPVVPGTSIAGALRHQVLRIARLVRAEWGDADIWVNRLFGPRFDGRRPKPGEPQRIASRLRVGEGIIENGKKKTQTRIAIDRFTHAPVDGALFSEQVIRGGKMSVRIELQNPNPGELGLILLAVRDLLEGDLPLGGSVAVGRGVMGGTATVSGLDRDAESSNKKNHRVKLTSGNDLSAELAALVSHQIDEFFNTPSLAFFSAESRQ